MRDDRGRDRRKIGRLVAEVVPRLDRLRQGIPEVRRPVGAARCVVVLIDGLDRCDLGDIGLEVPLDALGERHLGGRAPDTGAMEADANGAIAGEVNQFDIAAVGLDGGSDGVEDLGNASEAIGEGVGGDVDALGRGVGIGVVSHERSVGEERR